MDFFSGEFAVLEDLCKKTAPDRLSAVDRNNRASPVRVLEEMMTASLANIFKALFSRTLMSFDPVTAGKVLMPEPRHVEPQ